MKKLLYILVGLLCAGCSDMLKPSRPTIINNSSNDNFQDIDNRANEANTEYKIPINVIIWATEETIK